MGIYRINGKQVTREEFMSNAKGYDYSKPLQIVSDYEGYSCPITGNWIEGKSSHRENLKKHGCRVFEPGELEDFKRNKPADIERNAERWASEMCEKIGQQIGDL